MYRNERIEERIMKYNVRLEARRKKDSLPIYIEGVLDIDTLSLSHSEEKQMVLMLEMQANGNDVQIDAFTLHPVRTSINEI